MTKDESKSIRLPSFVLRRTRMEYISLLPYALLGTLLASTLALIPALHVYNVAGLIILFALRVSNFISGDAHGHWWLGRHRGAGRAHAHRRECIRSAARNRFTSPALDSRDGDRVHG